MPQRWIFLSVLSLLMLFSQRSDAVDTVYFRLAELQGPGWKAQDLRGTAKATKNGADLEFHIRRLDLPGRFGTLTDLRLQCPQARLGAVYDCPAGRLQAASDKLGPVRGTFSGRFQRSNKEGQGRFALFLKQRDQLDFTLSKRGMLWRSHGTMRIHDVSAWQPLFSKTSHPLPTEQVLLLDFTGRYLERAARGGLAVRGRYGHDDQFELALDWRAAHWRAQGSGSIRNLAPWMALVPVWPRNWKGQGELAFTFKGAGEGKRLADGQTHLFLNHASFSDPSGLQAGENLRVRMGIAVHALGEDGWRQQSSLRWEQGELLLNPWYGKVDQAPVQMQSRGRWQNTPGLLTLEQAKLDWPGIGQLTMRGQFPRDRWLQGPLDVSSDGLNMATFYEQIVKPFVKTRPLLAELGARGSLAFDLGMQAMTPRRLVMRLADLDLVDRQKRLGIHHLNANMHWRRDGRDDPLSISWDGMDIYRLPVGPAQIEALTSGDKVKLKHAVVIPILDGKLKVDDFEGRHLGRDGQWRMSATLSPLSLTQLTRRLGLPVFGGSLSAVVPDIQYARNVVRVGGVMQLDAFDGNIQVRKLQIADLFGSVPRLAADVDMRLLNMGKITQAFDFGRITGMMSGYVHGLRMEDWQPVHFDAVFRNVPARGVRQRISQRAVENLTRLGGGGALAAIQRGFLRFFKEFSYADLGMKIRLGGNAARIDGVTPARHGFYIMRGAGLPRVDVIGYNNKVDWRDFVARVQTAIQQDGVTVQ